MAKSCLLYMRRGLLPLFQGDGLQVDVAAWGFTRDIEFFT